MCNRCSGVIFADATPTFQSDVGDVSSPAATPQAETRISKSNGFDVSIICRFRCCNLVTLRMRLSVTPHAVAQQADFVGIERREWCRCDDGTVVVAAKVQWTKVRCNEEGKMVLLHAIIKKSQKTPSAELDLADRQARRGFYPSSTGQTFSWRSSRAACTLPRNGEWLIWFD